MISCKSVRTSILILSVILGISLLSMNMLPVQQALAVEELNKENLDYEITGGIVTSIMVDEDFGSLIIIIQAENDGELTITLPRAFMDSTLGDVDDDFFVLADGDEVVAEEISTTSEARTFTIPFEQGVEEIEIIGSTIDVSALSEPSVVEPEAIPETISEPTPEAIPETTEAVPEQISAQENADQGGGCLIATATFGTELSPQVQQLRETRDNVLSTESGASFMTSFNKLYYSFSPTIADWEREHPVFKETVKLTITPLLTSLSILNYVDIDSEEEMLGYGISVILLNIGMYFVAPATIIIKIRNSLRK